MRTLLDWRRRESPLKHFAWTQNQTHYYSKFCYIWKFSSESKLKSHLASFRAQIVRDPTEKQTWKINTQIFLMAYRYCPQNPSLNSQNPIISASKNAVRLMKQKLKGMYDCLKSQETIKPDGTIDWKGVAMKNKGLVQPRNTNSIYTFLQKDNSLI